MTKRALPSWMSGRDDGNREPTNSVDDNDKVDATQKKARGQGKERKNHGQESESQNKTSLAGPSKLDFSKLLDGVVFVLSGFVNPERGILRSQALEMGAEYQQDWNSKCTLLVCAFPNTPKFRQVEADCGTIVSKDWITDCYTQKKLVDIETYLMHVGKPWRKNSSSDARNQVHEASPSKSRKQEVKRPQAEPKPSISSKAVRSDSYNHLEEKFSPSKVKKWAIDDLNTTLTWLESQEEKPDPSEIRNVAAEGILTCLQDAVDLLDQQQDLQQLTEQWNTVPHAVQELTKVQGTRNSSASITEEDLRKMALTCKMIYEKELKGLSPSKVKKEEQKSNSNKKGKGKQDADHDIPGNRTEYDSDETVEMTEEEIDNAYNSIASAMQKS